MASYFTKKFLETPLRLLHIHDHYFSTETSQKRHEAIAASWRM